MHLYRRLAFWLVATPPGRWWSYHLYSTIGPSLDRFLYRLSRGRLTTGTGIVPILLLTTAGRGTGRNHTTPVAYMRDGPHIVIVASNVANPGPPQWFRNLQAQPIVDLSIRGRTQPYHARVTAEEERTQLWTLLTQEAPTYALYQTRAGRELPVLVFTPVAASGASR